MLDGTKHDVTGSYMPLADRVAFERRWGVAFETLFDVSAEGDNIVGPEWRDERGAFFCWRVLERAGVPVGDFDAFVEQVADINVERVDGPVDPTEPGPLPTN
jgi:hypothetical protein